VYDRGITTAIAGAFKKVDEEFLKKQSNSAVERKRD
jgi:hypothetical protein